MTEDPGTRWRQLTGGTSGEEYAARFARLAGSGKDVHGEANFCHALLPAAGRVLDAGCGTGRVGIRLAELGHDVTGVDVDDSMLAVARREAPGLSWLRGDLADLPDAVREASYDLVVMAGNVVPLLAPGTLPATLDGLAAVLEPGGRVVAGFGLDAAHLPSGCPVTPLAEYEAAAERSHLALVDQFATWERAPFEAAGGYVVAVHRRE